jgi:hypothetical protein
MYAGFILPVSHCDRDLAKGLYYALVTVNGKRFFAKLLILR